MLAATAAGAAIAAPTGITIARTALGRIRRATRRAQHLVDLLLLDRSSTHDVASAIRSLRPAAASALLATALVAWDERDVCLASPPTAPTTSPADKTVTGVLFFWPSDATPEGGTPGPDEPLASDRPDFTEASSTVGAGVVQLEMGYTLVYDDGDPRTIQHSLPEALVRIGVLRDWLELRVGWNFGSETTIVGGASDTESGSRDVYLGVKLGLTPQQGWLPEMALAPQMLIPVGGPLSGGSRVLPGVNLLYGWEFAERFSAGGNTQMNRRVDDGSRDDYAELIQTFAVGSDLSKHLGAYVEWFVFAPIAADTARTEQYFDGGFTWRVTNDLQLDIRAGTGLNNAAADIFGGVGAVVRF